MPTISGTTGSDKLEGTSGSDKINAGDGNDFMFYNVPANNLPATSDVYSGGGGIDMAVLRFSYDQWINLDNQKQLDRYFSWHNAVKLDSAGQISNGSNSDFTFNFGASTLKLQMTEQLGVVVDGNFLGGPFAVYKRHAPQANDDKVLISEDDGPVTIDVLNSSRPGEADSVPDLVKDLRVLDNAGPAHGTVTLLKNSSNPADWKFIYTVDNAYYQNLPQDSSATDSFRYQVTDASGATSCATVQITIRGLNDSAPIVGLAAFDLTEDLSPTSTNQLQVTGHLSVSDPDAGESQFNTVFAAAPGTLGTLQLQTDGSFTYEINNADVQYLGSGQERTEKFTVVCKDGTATKDISFVINGVNDPAQITGQAAYELAEDLNPTSTDKLKVTGQLSVNDPDAGQSQFNTVVAAAPGTLGTLQMQTDGSFTYEINNADVQYLGSGKERTEKFTVASKDGSATKDISFVIKGENDLASIDGKDSYELTEDLNPTATDKLQVTGQLSVSDLDAGEGQFNTVVVAAPGTLGTLQLQTDGSFTYQINNADVQYLDSGKDRTEVFTVASKDGSATKDISFVINGENDQMAPQANPDVIWVTDNAIVSLPTSILLANDTDADSDKKDLKIISFSAGESGGEVPMLNTDPITGKDYFSFDASKLSGDQFIFKYLVSDESNLTREGQVTVNLQSLSNLENNILNLQSKDYAGAYLVGDGTVNSISAGNGPSIMIGDTLASSMLTGGEFADVVQVGNDVSIRKEFIFYVETIETYNKYIDERSYNDVLNINGSELIGGAPGDSADTFAADDMVSIARSLDVAVISDLYANAQGGHVSMAVTAALTQNISENRLYGDLISFQNGAVGGADQLGMGVGMHLIVAAGAKSEVRDGTVAIAKALARPTLDVLMQNNVLYGDAQSMEENSRGGDDTVEFCDSIAIAAYAYSQTILSPITTKTTIVAEPKLDFTIKSNTLLGDAEIINGSSAGKDFLSFANNIVIESKAQKATLDTSITTLQVSITDNFIFGDAIEMNQSRGDNDELRFCRDWMYNLNEFTVLNLQVSDNSLYGDAYIMSKSTGGDDVLFSADIFSSVTYLTGDSVKSDSDSIGGNDRLIGGRGNDHMWGDFGGKDDELPAEHGQFGKDVFSFSGFVGDDVIYDFHPSEDQIEFAGSTGLRQFSDLAGKIFATGDEDENTLIQLGEIGSITLIGIRYDQLTADDFQFIS